MYINSYIYDVIIKILLNFILFYLYISSISNSPILFLLSLHILLNREMIFFFKRRMNKKLHQRTLQTDRFFFLLLESYKKHTCEYRKLLFHHQIIDLKIIQMMFVLNNLFWAQKCDYYLALHHRNVNRVMEIFLMFFF